MEKNKTGKYFKYAIGEIALVVIGILIALQINNWNSFRNERKLEQNLLHSLKAEFERNLIELNRDHKLNTAAQNAALALMQDDRLLYSMAKTDSLLGVINNYAVFDARTGTFDETIASGKLRLIQNDSLTALLSQWTGELGDLRDDVLLRREHLVLSVSPTFRKFLPIRNSDKTNYREDYDRELVIKPLKVSPSNYTSFYNSLEVDGVLFELYLNQTFVTVNEESLVIYIKEVIKSLEENIHHD
ncbi:MAG: hypothetical protein ACI83H_001144 [Glaciecola sp.]|jgi:hypothetical protein